MYHFDIVQTVLSLVNRLMPLLIRHRLRVFFLSINSLILICCLIIEKGRKWPTDNICWRVCQSLNLANLCKGSEIIMAARESCVESCWMVSLFWNWLNQLRIWTPQIVLRKYYPFVAWAPWQNWIIQFDQFGNWNFIVLHWHRCWIE